MVLNEEDFEERDDDNWMFHTLSWWNEDKPSLPQQVSAGKWVLPDKNPSLKYNLDINIQIKMCQILIQIPNSSSWDVSRPVLQHIIYITLLLCQSEETAVRSTSLAALQQIVTVALEYSVNNQSSVINIDDNINDNKHQQNQPRLVFIYYIPQ